MCTVSGLFDTFHERWNNPTFHDPWSNPSQWPSPALGPTIPTQEEIDEFRDLLEKARQWDRDHGEPDCEMEEKRQKLKDLAEELGVEIDFI